MLLRSSLAGVLGSLVLVGVGGAPPPPRPATPQRLRGVLLTPDQATQTRLGSLRRDGYNAAALTLDERSAPGTAAAARRVRGVGLTLYYWIEVGRCPALADAHPEWMASLQGHPEWRRRFPKLPLPADGEVVKNYPWVPVGYRETFAAHLDRVKRLLEGRPAATGIFLNDLQAAPAACGCGNRFCRWTTDYGAVRTATPLGPDAAARFVSSVARMAPEAAIIPVWATECEEHEMAKGAACDGVPCFSGTCWYAWSEQLMPVTRGSERLGVLATYRALGRADARYGGEAAWVGRAIATFAEMPPKRKGEAVTSDRLIAVLQGWDVTSAQRNAQIQETRRAGAGGYLVAETPIEQEWTPRLHRLRPAGTTRSGAEASPASEPQPHGLRHPAGTTLK